ncbi:MAG: DUF1648 domain-containing protein [Candidatus Bathyarchaeota archaeon]|nr:MAG: PH domain-containing protein [Candidatus Bathyarchaeum tardum]WNZ29756.1 MAG: DUF1648 domain-containing protein [Candidatus Bathyarchaeota archaeon]
MEKVFRPSQTKSSFVWVIILLLIIDVPILALLFFSFQEISVLFIALISILLIIDGVLLSFAFFAKRMEFTVQQNIFSVSFGFSKRKIPYSAIKDVKVSQTALLFRLFGASWPGMHWGLYTAKDLGKVWVYSTKVSGDFVLLELTDGNKIVVSPEDPQELCNELNTKRSQFGTATDVQAVSSSKRFVYLQVATVAGAFFVFLGYLLWIYPTLPETIPVHFDLNMVPNRWGHKSELFIIAGIAAIFPILNSVLVLKFGKYAKTMTVFLGIVFVLLMALFFGIVYFTQSLV